MAHELYDRLNNITIVKIYSNMIKNGELQVVRDLYENLNTHCSTHTQYQKLLPLFKERLGE